MDSVFLAIDAGTTNIKAALADRDGNFLATAGVGVDSLMPYKGWVEMDMETVWQGVCRTVLLLYEKNPDLFPQIKMAGVCGQGDGAWLIDKEGKPVRNAVLWNDTRAGGLIDYEEVNRLCLATHSSPLFPGANAVILKWLKLNEPEAYSRIGHVLHCKDWINYRLTGAAVTDRTDASTALMDIFTDSYRSEILDCLNIPETYGWLPEIISSGNIIGETTEEIGNLLHIPIGMPVIAGALDVLATAAGCGMLSPGQKGSIIGTTLCNYAALDESGARKNAEEIGSVLCHAMPGIYMRVMAGLSGTPAIDWARREIAGGESFEKIEIGMANIPAGSEGVMFHPYLHGERAPFRDPSASAGFFGLRANHTKYHMLRAVYEGMAYSLYDCHRSLPANGNKEIVLAGGAASSCFICRMVSDVLGMPVLRMHEKELGILGLTRIMLRTAGLESEQSPDAYKTDRFEPDLKLHAVYTEKYAEFTALREAVRPFWK